MNLSEELVYNLCKKSFLSLWSYANPKGKDGKELCDVLVVCDPDIIIISVKEIELKCSGDVSTDWKRWQNRAIEKSYPQIYGAENWIKNATHVITSDGREALPFPEKDRRRIHRISVALGGKGQVPIYFGEFGKGYVHVFDEDSLNIIIKELDTIADFIKYLNDKEFLFMSGIIPTFFGREEDLLALYIHHRRIFPITSGHIIIMDDFGRMLRRNREYIAKKEEDKISYAWDGIIELFSEDFHKGNLQFGLSLTDVEMSMRLMAREDRFNRRILGKAFFEFLDLNKKNKIRARCVPCPSGVSYVFLACPRYEDRKYRLSELGARCFVIRGLYPENKTVVGIATETYEKGKGFSMDAMYYFKQKLDAKDKEDLNYLKNELGYFSEPEITNTCR